jgi:aldose 1-epimerase
MEVVHLESSKARVHVHPMNGARIGSFVVNDTPIFVASAASTFDWGCYPMVPFAGRLRNATLTFRNAAYTFPANDPSGRPHAIHGTVFDTQWAVESVSTSRVELTHELAAPWPFAGTVRHMVELSDTALTCTLSLTAHNDMPAMLGWHPWFVKPQSAVLPFRTMLQRGDNYLPTGRSVQAQLENADDCFTDLDGVIALTIGDQHLQVQSDCSHWVVYNQPAHATCVEPQSGPPNEVNDAPFLLPAGETMTRHFTISWL